MDNIKGNITRKKRFKKVLCYFCLVILIVLLFLPLAFKIIFRDRVTSTVTKNVVEILTCEKGTEYISSTFQNSEPHNLLYRVGGNYQSKETTTEGENKTNNGTTGTNTEEISPLLEKIRSYSEVTYDEVNNVTSFSVDVNNLRGVDDYDLVFVSLHNQEYYYASIGFVCSVKTIE